jgi:DNA polymerase-3 subunit epsilon
MNAPVYITLDTETTGLEPGSRPVEIHSLVLSEDGTTLGQFHRVIDPLMPIPPDVTEIHGITDRDVKECPSLYLVLSEWENWMRTCRPTHLIAHNAPYDVGVMSWALDAAGLAHPSVMVIDTCAMAREIKATKKNSLDALIEHYGIKRQGSPHRADSDGIACRDYWLIARKLLPNYQPTPWVAPHSKPQELPPVLANFPGLVQSGAPFSFAYTDAKGNQTNRTITPYGWAEQGGKVYFHGLCHLRNERRTFLASSVVPIADAPA